MYDTHTHTRCTRAHTLNIVERDTVPSVSVFVRMAGARTHSRTTERFTLPAQGSVNDIIALTQPGQKCSSSAVCEREHASLIIIAEHTQRATQFEIHINRQHSTHTHAHSI